MSGEKDPDDPADSGADVIPFELLKLDRAVAARLEEIFDFVPDAKKLVKEAFRRLRAGDLTALEKMDGEVREYLEAELLRLIQTDPSLREIVTLALLEEAEASILDERATLLEANLSDGEKEAVQAFRASLGREQLDALYELMTKGAAASQRDEDRFASSLLNEAIARAPDYFEAYLLRGVNHARSGRHASALKDAEHALELCPDSARAFELKASALRGLDREDEAMSVLGTALKILPGSTGLRIVRGAGYLRREAFRDAIKDLDVAVKEGAGAIAYILRGEARLGVDAFASARKDFESALSLDDVHPRALGGLVQSLARRRDWADLVEAASRLIEVVGPDPEALAHRAHARLELGQPFGSLLDALAALSVADHAMARRWADSAVARLGLEPATGTDELMVVLENAELLETHGASATQFLNDVEKYARSETFAVTLARAIRIRETGSPKHVCRLARRAAELPGATLDATFVLAGASLEARDYPAAISAVEAIVADGADGVLGWSVADAVLIGAAAIEESDGVEAAVEYLSGVEPYFGISREMGRLRAELGDDDGARRALRAAVEMRPDDPSTLFENARFEASRDPDKALEFVSHLVAVAPHYGWAITGEAAFAPLRGDERFEALVRGSSTLAAAIPLACDFADVQSYAADAGWVWRWLGQKTSASHRLVSWDVPSMEANVFFMDDAVSNVRGLVFYGERAAEAAEETRRALPGALRFSVDAVSADPIEAIGELQRAGWATSQGLATKDSFDAVVIQCLQHPDAHVRWRAVSAAAQADSGEVDAQLRELAYASDEPRTRQEALLTLGKSGGKPISIAHHDRWETFLVYADREVVERCLWNQGLVLLGENEPDQRSGYEMTWAREDASAVATYFEDEEHGVSLLAFAGDADSLVREVAAVAELRALEDAIEHARTAPSVASVLAVSALLPEDEVAELVSLSNQLLDSGDEAVRRACCDHLAGRREWLPEPVCKPPETTLKRFILVPTELPEDVSRFASERGWIWSDAEPTSDREHTSPRACWRTDEFGEFALELHRFGFWYIEVRNGNDLLHALVGEEFEHLETKTLVERTEHPDPSVRADAVHQLGVVAEVTVSKELIEVLERALSDTALEVRTHALEAVCIGARIEELRDAVAARVEAEEDPDLRDYAAVLLDLLGD